MTMIASAPIIAKAALEKSGAGSSYGLTVEELDETSALEWDAFVARAGGSFFHKIGWLQSVAQNYGYQIKLLAVRDRQNNITGVLPLVDVKSPLFGRSLVSSGFAVGGGILSEDGPSHRALADYAEQLGETAKASYVELRGGAAPQNWLSKQDVYAGFEKTLPAKEEDALKAIPRKKRADLRKAIKAEGEGRLKFIAHAPLEKVYALYARSVRDLGTPVFGKNWLRGLQQNFSKDEISFSLVEADGIAIAGLVTFWHGKKVMPYYGGALPAARGLHAYDFLYWKIMCQAIERGYSQFDFGRSKQGTGAFAYKTYWGFEPQPLVYHYKLITADAMPDINPNNPKFALATKIWKRLPLFIANHAGPVLARNLV
jgi:FemAB-related protein (PEP-CTERM system-associated)